MKQCPIASSCQHQPKANAFSSLSYEELEELIQKQCVFVEKIPQKTIAFQPRYTIEDIAFFFAAWRCEKAIFPLSHHLPNKAVLERVKLTDSALVIPKEIPLGNRKKIDTIDENIIATLIETSSSSKIVCHSLLNHLTSADSCARALSLEKTDKYCLNLPLFHVSGIALILRTFLVGATLLLPHEIELATHLSMVPTQLYRHLNSDQIFPNLKCLLIGGAPLPYPLLREAVEKKLPIFSSYGMTETASMAVIKKGMGRTTILDHIQLKLADDGEILLQGPSIMRGYLGKKPHRGWLHTRDLGEINSSEGLKIIGRKDRQFISGGENIQPEEIERALLSIPHIIQAKVSPMKDDEFGMRPKAELFCTRNYTTDQLQEKLRKNLPRHKIPSEFIFNGDLDKFSKIGEN